jgi:hypothetical protein
MPELQLTEHEQNCTTCGDAARRRHENQQRRAADPHLVHQQGQDTDCSECWPYHPSADCECDDCYDNYRSDYGDEEEEYADIMSRSWAPGPHEGDDIDGEFIRAGRTVGVEYERGSSYGRDGWEDRLLPEVGIGSDHCGIEVRTPPAAGLAADRFTEHTLRELIASDFPTGNDSGLHVHVFFPEGYPEGGGFYDEVANRERGRTDQAMARFLALWSAIEHVAFEFCPERRRSSWSRQVNRTRAERQEMVNRLLGEARTGASPSWAQSRYSSVNANQYGYRTIEFRGHSSTNEVEHVLAWVAFVQGAVELSQKVSYITIRRISDATSHKKRAQLLMQAGKRHGIWTDTAYAAIRQELGLSPARVRTMPAQRAA